MSNTTALFREIELKFEVTRDQMRRLRSKQVLKDLGDGPQQEATLRSIYYDTPDQALRDHGMSLRVRQNADGWVQTAKIGRDLMAGLSSPIEIEHPVPGPAIDIGKLKSTGVADEVVKLLDKSSLVPMFETIFSRTTRQLRAPCGAAVEVAFDSGKVKAGNSTSQIREMELELKSGERSALFALAEQLTSGEAVRFSDWSKAERGFRLCGGQLDTVPDPQAYVTPDISRTSTTAEAFSSQLQACARQIAHNWKVVLDSDAVEGPHQLRIGLRRLRSTLRAYKTVADSKNLRHLDRKAKQLAAVAGQLRDADVLVEEIVSAPAMPDGTELTGLRELLEAERKIIRSDVRAKLAGDDMMRLLLRLGAFIESPKKQIPKKKNRNRPVISIANSALRKSWSKVEMKGRDIARLTIEERHSMRKSLKELRYQIDAFANLYPRHKVKPFCKKLKSLQDVFGYLNDVAMAERITSLISAKQAAKPNIQRAAGFALGWHTARSQFAWRQARHEWKDLERSRKFWKA